MMFFIYTKYIMQQYYGNYDKNIISVKGGGKVTQNKSSSKSNRMGIISPEFKNDVNYMPPLSKITNRGNKINTNAYINPDNYVKEDDDSNNYYYTSQQINDVNIINKQEANSSIGRILNMENPIQFPPGLVTTEPGDEEENKEKTMKEIMKEKIKEKVMKRLLSEIRKKKVKKDIDLQNEMKREIMNKEKSEECKKIAGNIGKKSWISENRLYTIQSTLDDRLPWKNKEFVVNLNSNNENLEKIENFTDTESNEKVVSNNEIDYSLVLFCTIMFTIIVMYFIMRKE
jgi:hypothetical protein